MSRRPYDRTRRREWELPEGSGPPAEAAERIVAEEKLAATARKHPTARRIDGPLTPADRFALGGREAVEELRSRSRLMALAREGDAEAIRELRERFRAWVVAGP
jgi:hypothetical protein